jgi:MoxR-like ATPase
VRLQRVIAASALLSGRLEARISDLWVLRHIWDREEQIEILEAQVLQCLQQENATNGDHPRARHAEAPDPEELSQALESLSEKLSDESATLRESARDELRLLANRIEWVRNDTARTALQSRAADLWSLAGAS